MCFKLSFVCDVSFEATPTCFQTSTFDGIKHLQLSFLPQDGDKDPVMMALKLDKNLKTGLFI